MALLPCTHRTAASVVMFLWSRSPMRLGKHGKGSRTEDRDDHDVLDRSKLVSFDCCITYLVGTTGDV